MPLLFLLHKVTQFLQYLFRYLKRRILLPLVMNLL
jgi:hypothetical protein